ncbi:MAG TPA: hypothetical protein VK116_00280, partial [Planctomycetota bacterium]|nr:hypothetical protein [Planctomycetota bacterium]
IYCTSKSVHILGSRTIFFDQFGTEIGPGGACDVDFLVEDSVLIEFQRTDMGNVTETPTALKVVNSENIAVKKSWVAGTIDADVNTKALRFSDQTAFTKPLSNWLVGAGTVFPKMVIDPSCTLITTAGRRISGEFSDVPSSFTYTLTGAGDPEGTVTAHPNTLFFRTDGSEGTRLYAKTTGTGNTGWTAIA